MQFSLTRFYYLFIKQWRENKKAYILGLISLPILTGVAFLFTTYTSNLTENNQGAIFSAAMIIFGGIFCSTLLSEYSPKPKGVRSLILPVSAIEKLLVAVVYGLIIYPILYIILVYPVLILVNYIDYEIFGNLNMSFTMDAKNFFKLLMATTVLSSVLFCSLLYRKFIFIKAFLTFASFIFILTLSNNLINKALIGDSQPITFSKEFLKNSQLALKDARKINFQLKESGLFSSLQFNAGSYGSRSVSPSEPLDSMAEIISILICPVMLIACFYRIKETEL